MTPEVLHRSRRTLSNEPIPVSIGQELEKLLAKSQDFNPAGDPYPVMYGQGVLCTHKWRSLGSSQAWDLRDLEIYMGN